MPTNKTEQKITSTRISLANAFEIGFLGGLGVLVAIMVGQSFTALATIITYMTAAIFIALGLDPLVRVLEKRGMPRGFSILTVVLSIPPPRLVQVRSCV